MLTQATVVGLLPVLGFSFSVASEIILSGGELWVPLPGPGPLLLGGVVSPSSVLDQAPGDVGEMLLACPEAIRINFRSRAARHRAPDSQTTPQSAGQQAPPSRPRRPLGAPKVTLEWQVPHPPGSIAPSSLIRSERTEVRRPCLVRNCCVVLEVGSALAVELRVQGRLLRWQTRGTEVTCFPGVIDLSVSHGNLME